jgi:hypothetical protein
MLHSVGLERFRKKRETKGDLTILRSKHVAYLGLYNAVIHRDSIISWLPELEMGDVPLLVVDNCSSDETWTVLPELISKFHPNSVFVRNAINFGGYGSLAANLDLLDTTTWITTFHQDDRYSRQHLIIHSKEIATSPSDLGIISSEQISYLPSGHRVALPRASWFLEADYDPSSFFLANLVHHTLPFSGASIRSAILEEISIPWHSTSFPDTEIVLRMTPRWRGIITDQAPVRYLENPSSESHSISLEEREFGAFMALIRVFRSEGFQRICLGIDESALDNFVTGLSAGIATRLLGKHYVDLCTAVALEAMTEFVGPQPSLAKRLEPIYLGLPAEAAGELLHRLHTEESASSNSHSKDLRHETNRFAREPLEHHGKSKSKSNGIGLKWVAARLLGLLPGRMSKWLIRSTVLLLNALGLSSKWKR